MRHLVSLGVRCEVAFQLRMHSGENVAHFFDWLATPPNGLIDIIKRDFEVFAPDHLDYIGDRKPGCVIDRLTGVRFHHHFSHYNHWITPYFHQEYAPFIGKFRYLAQRFRDYAQNKPVTYVRREMNMAQAEALEAAFFDRFPNADAQFLYLNTEGEPFKTTHGHSRTFVTEASLGNCVAWSRMLLEEGLIETPFRLSTLEILGPSQEGYNLGVDNRFSVDQLTTAVAENPVNANFSLELARAYRGRGDHAAGLEAIDVALSKQPDNPIFLLEKLYIQRLIARKVDRSYAEALVALSGHKGTENAALMAGDAFFELKDLEAALRCYDQALVNEPTHADIVLRKANTLNNLRRYKEALLAAQFAIRLAPGEAKAHALAARLLAKHRRGEEAIVAALKACELSDTPDSHYNLATVYEALGDTPNAVAVYEKIMKIGDAVNGKAKQRLGELRMAMPETDPASAVDVTTDKGADKGDIPSSVPWFQRLLGRT